MEVVWSKRLRAFHWFLVVFIAIEFFTDDDQLMWIHEFVGYFIAILIVFRFYIGFWGEKYELFKNSYMFMPRDLGKWYGHNIPASYVLGFMQILIMIIFISGLMLLGATEFEGVMVWVMMDISVATSDLIHLIHELSTDILLALIATHLAGLSMANFIHDEKVIQSMITGKKERDL